MRKEMSMFGMSWRADSEALVQFRPRIGALVSAVGSALLLPFIVMHAVDGRWDLSVLFSATASVLLINVFTVHSRQKPLVPFGPVVTGLSVAVCLSILAQGQNGVLWAYPVLFIGFFVLSRRWANLIAMGLMVGVSIATWQSVGPALASRAAATLFLNFVMINLVLNVLDHLHNSLIRQATLDPLTGAFNRRHFQARINSITEGDRAVSDVLVVFDIDHFKRVNDAYGHDIGDQVLKATVQLARSVFRSTDEVFRMGGEEFAVLLYDIEGKAAEALAEALRTQAENARILPCSESAVTISIGLACRETGMGAEQWYAQADSALYMAKRRGRNRIVVQNGADHNPFSDTVQQLRQIAG